MRFIRYWMGRPKLPLGARYLFTAEEVAYAPLAEEGDAFWASEYGDAVSAVPNLVPTNVDIRDRALVALNALAPDLTLEQMRAGGRVEAIGRVRRELVAMLLAGGHRNGAIARCLNLSPSHVSAVAAEVRSREFGALMRQDHAGMGRS
jgi:hypothetical protein